MEGYDHKKIEKKWQKAWEEEDANRASDSGGEKFYPLVEFPYPSGEGMHVGHVRSYTAMDIVARKRRGEGFNVLYPMGWDAFGLPTENYAVKTGIHPAVVTKKNTDNFRRQLKMLGLSFDWSREINTTDPKYYKWTQWIFLQFFKKGLAYKARSFINWCPSCKIGLANEEAIGGICERCGGPTEKREKEQWMLAITKYADRLDKDLDEVDYLEKIKIQQRNWIGKSEGAEIDFAIKDSDQKIKVFTTRADTIFGATYLIAAPEHPIIPTLKGAVENWDEVVSYIASAGKKTELERTAEGKEKTGVELKGVKAINPASGEEIPVFVADYVLAHYGTGAIMAVPAHDERDWEFAKKFGLVVRPVIDPAGSPEGSYSNDEVREGKIVYTDPEGMLFNSGKFSGLSVAVAQERVTSEFGAKKITYKLRDWVFSRQRYWGEPIPLVHCEKDGWVAVPDDQLPVVLPDVERYEPRDDGQSPLASVTDWVNTTCPQCGGPGKRETDTMPNWAGSSWYYLRYMDPHDDKEFASKEKLDYWKQVDWYNGGMEHTTLHLLYSRFWHKFLYDLGLVPTSEPYQKRTSHGLILAHDGSKMSKSKGNVVNPDELAEIFGADSLRLYEMFMGPFDQAIAWNTDGVVGVRRFLERVWRFGERSASSADFVSPGSAGGLTKAHIEPLLNATIKKVSDDIESLKMNTAVSALMILFNAFEKEGCSADEFKTFLKLLAPFAPHIAEELWRRLGETESIHAQSWPRYDESKIVSDTATIVIQINGKSRGSVDLPAQADQPNVEAASRSAAGKWLEGRQIARVVYVPGRLINFVLAQ